MANNNPNSFWHHPRTPQSPGSSFNRFLSAVQNDSAYNIRYMASESDVQRRLDKMQEEVNHLSEDFLVSFHLVRAKINHLSDGFSQMTQTNREVLMQLRLERQRAEMTQKRARVEGHPPSYIVGLISTVCFVTPIAVLLIELAKSSGR